MKMKRNKTFDERLRLFEEKKEGDGNKIIVEDSKLKHGDDYREKLIKESERFQDKITNKESKRISDVTIENHKKPKRPQRKIRGESLQVSEDNKGIFESIDSYKEVRADSNVNSEESVFVSVDSKDGQIDKKHKLRKNAEEFRKKEEAKVTNNDKDEVYDPLSKDTDNDGIADRYDNNFKDSDYFESTYDVEYPKDKLSLADESSFKKKINRKIGKDFQSKESKDSVKKENSKSRNYDDKLFTRTRGKEDKTSKGKEAVENRQKKNNQLKKIKRNNSDKSVKAGILAGTETSQRLVRDYLSSGSDENVGVEGAEKIADANSKLIHHGKSVASKRKNKANYSLKNEESALQDKKSKLDFRDETERTSSNQAQKKENYKNHQKRRRMKESIRERKHTRVRDRIKKSLKESAIGLKNFIERKGKGLLIGIVAIIVLGTFFISFGGSGLSVMMNTTNSSLITSYLSDETVLSNVESYFFSQEEGLRDELASVETNYPGYDEYVINQNEYVGHNIHELLSYITARYGEVKNLSEVKSSLDELFLAMYKVDNKEDIEIRYKTVTETYVDEYGEEYTISYEEPYEYKKLIATLKKREMDSIIREVFNDYPENLKHYESLFASQGNMAEVFGNTHLIIANGGVGGGQEYEASAEVQKKIVDAAYITPSPGAGWCAMWVSQVYQNAGLGYLGGNANDMYRNFTYTSDRSKLQVGMLVAVESSSSGGELGAIYGHVGIYIGDGMVMDNIGHVRVTSLDNWIATFCKHSPVGFGFPPNVQK